MTFAFGDAVFDLKAGIGEIEEEIARLAEQQGEGTELIGEINTKRMALAYARQALAYVEQAKGMLT